MPSSVVTKFSSTKRMKKKKKEKLVALIDTYTQSLHTKRTYTKHLKPSSICWLFFSPLLLTSSIDHSKTWSQYPIPQIWASCLLEEEDFLHLDRRCRKVKTSDGSFREYEALVSFGVEDTIIGYPWPLPFITWKFGKSIPNINNYAPIKTFILSV